VKIRGNFDISQREWALAQLRVVEALPLEGTGAVAWQKLRDLMVSTLPDPDQDANIAVLPLIRADILAHLSDERKIASVHVCNDPSCTMDTVSVYERSEGRPLTDTN